MSLLNKLLVSRNTWTIFVGMLFVWIGFSGLGTMLGPKNPDKIFLMYFTWVSCSYLGAAVVVKILSKIIGLKFSFSNLYIDLFWVFVLSLGSLIFCCFFQKAAAFYPALVTLLQSPLPLLRLPARTCGYGAPPPS